MKVNIEIEASAREMREFMGLPDIKPLQDDMMQAIRDNVQQGQAGFDPFSLMRPLFPAQMQSMEMLHKAFWDAFNVPGDDNKPGNKNKPANKPGDKAKPKPAVKSSAAEAGTAKKSR